MSTVERDHVSDFIYNAELNQQRFQAVRNTKLVTTDAGGKQTVIDMATGLDDAPSAGMLEEAQKEMATLRIPRRPAWDGLRSPKDQRLLENVAFYHSGSLHRLAKRFSRAGRKVRLCDGYSLREKCRDLETALDGYRES